MNVRLIKYVNNYFGFIPKLYKFDKEIRLDWFKYGVVAHFKNKLPRIIPTTIRTRRHNGAKRFIPKILNQRRKTFVYWWRWEFFFHRGLSLRSFWRDWDEDSYLCGLKDIKHYD